MGGHAFECTLAFTIQHLELGSSAVFTPAWPPPLSNRRDILIGHPERERERQCEQVSKMFAAYRCALPYDLSQTVEVLNFDAQKKNRRGEESFSEREREEAKDATCSQARLQEDGKSHSLYRVIITYGEGAVQSY